MKYEYMIFVFSTLPRSTLLRSCQSDRSVESSQIPIANNLKQSCNFFFFKEKQPIADLIQKINVYVDWICFSPDVQSISRIMQVRNESPNECSEQTKNNFHSFIPAKWWFVWSLTRESSTRRTSCSIAEMDWMIYRCPVIFYTYTYTTDLTRLLQVTNQMHRLNYISSCPSLEYATAGMQGFESGISTTVLFTSC